MKLLLQSHDNGKVSLGLVPENAGELLQINEITATGRTLKSEPRKYAQDLHSGFIYYEGVSFNLSKE